VGRCGRCGRKPYRLWPDVPAGEEIEVISLSERAEANLRALTPPFYERLHRTAASRETPNLD
jgi:hypothetical protein